MHENWTRASLANVRHIGNVCLYWTLLIRTRISTHVQSCRGFKCPSELPLPTPVTSLHNVLIWATVNYHSEVGHNKMKLNNDMNLLFYFNTVYTQLHSFLCRHFFFPTFASVNNKKPLLFIGLCYSNCYYWHFGCRIL